MFSSQALGRALGSRRRGPPESFECDLMFHSVSALLLLLRLGSPSFWADSSLQASTTAVGQRTSVSHCSNLLASVLGCRVCFQPIFFFPFFQRRSAEYFEADPLWYQLLPRRCMSLYMGLFLWTKLTLRVNKLGN